MTHTRRALLPSPPLAAATTPGGGGRPPAARPARGPRQPVRFATFNASLNRAPRALVADLSTPENARRPTWRR